MLAPQSRCKQGTSSAHRRPRFQPDDGPAPNRRSFYHAERARLSSGFG